MRLKDKVALVTGGSRGIGAAIVKRLSEEGAKVYFTYLSSPPRAGTNGFACDVRKKADVEKTVAGVLEKEKTLDVLVNNAGIIRDSLFLTLTDEDWDEVMETNLKGAYHFCKAVARHMVSQGAGRIINISSVVGSLGGYGQANYAASKGALNAFTKSLASELASKRVTVNAVSPGMVNTDLSAPVRSAFGEKIKERIPLGSFAEPGEIAALVAFLASEEARYITGQVITMDGGLGLLGRR